MRGATYSITVFGDEGTPTTNGEEKQAAPVLPSPYHLDSAYLRASVVK